jgi:DNA replication initiation complex subunit (GINS family)
MPDAEELRKRIAELKAKVREAQRRSEDPRRDPDLRALRKRLKRAQRRLRKMVPLSLEEQIARAQAFAKRTEGRIDALIKAAKKKSGDPHVHSLRKRLKSLTKKVKRLTKLQRRRSEGAPSS